MVEHYGVRTFASLILKFMYPPGQANGKPRGAFASKHTTGPELPTLREYPHMLASCANVLASDRMCKSQRKGRPESHLTNRGVGVRWGLAVKPVARLGNSDCHLA